MSLGWLTESSTLPRKQKNIEGVSANTMVELKALIYDKQSQNKSKSLIGNAIEKRKSQTAKNKNVEDRIHRDKMAIRQQEHQDVENNLKKKAVLYEKMLRGELEDYDDSLVDFERKEEINEYQSTVDENFLIGKKEIFSKDMENAVMRKEWENSIIDEEKKEKSRLRKSKVTQTLTTSTAAAREKVKEIRREKKKKLKKRIMKLKLRSQKNKQEDSD